MASHLGMGYAADSVFRPGRAHRPDLDQGADRQVWRRTAIGRRSRAARCATICTQLQRESPWRHCSSRAATPAARVIIGSSCTQPRCRFAEARGRRSAAPARRRTLRRCRSPCRRSGASPRIDRMATLTANFGRDYLQERIGREFLLAQAHRHRGRVGRRRLRRPARAALD